MEAPEPAPIEIVDGGTRWVFEPTFLQSRWTCIWGRGCQGILDHPAAELQQGCCSVGAELADAEESMTVSALAATLDDDVFERRRSVDADDVFSDSSRTNTKVVDGACIFLNGPGFAGGAGCALHLAALRAGDSPIDWKPSVCWQLPIRVEWHDDGGPLESAHVRRWTRADWGSDGETMAWCCTEEPEAYVGEHAVIDSLADELRAVTGDAVYVELRRRLS